MPVNADRDIDVVVAGYLGVDLLPEFPEDHSVPFAELFRPGKLIETGPLRISLGGAVANTGLALQRFGKRVLLNGLVGQDGLGDTVLQLLGAHDAEAGVRRTDAAETAYGIVIAPPGVDRMFLESTGCNRVFSCDDVDFDAVARSRLFHLGYPPLMERLFLDNGVELERIFARARECGAITSLDMALPDPDTPAGQADWQQILERTLPHVDVFLPSIEELFYMLDRPRFEKCAAMADDDIVGAIPDNAYRELGERLLALGTKIVAIKAGHRGLYLLTGDAEGVVDRDWSRRTLRIEAAPVEESRMKNACGAGDAAIAGFLAALLDGLTIDQAGRLAAVAGRDSLYGSDTLEGLRDWDRMLEELVTTG